MKENKSVRRRLDINKDGVLDERDIAAGLGELFDLETRGRFEQHAFVPAAKSILAGLGVYLTVLVTMRQLLMYIPQYNHLPLSMAQDWAIFAGVVTGGIWIVGEMWVSTAKPIKAAKDDAYQSGWDDAETQYTAEITRLNDSVAAASSRANVPQSVQLTDTENQFVTKGQVFLNFLWDAHSRTSKASFTKYEGVSQPTWGRIRDRFVALGIIDNDRNILVERVDAQQAWATHVEKIKNTRARGATPVL